MHMKSCNYRESNAASSPSIAPPCLLSPLSPYFDDEDTDSQIKRLGCTFMSLIHNVFVPFSVFTLLKNVLLRLVDSIDIRTFSKKIKPLNWQGIELRSGWRSLKNCPLSMLPLAVLARCYFLQTSELWSNWVCRPQLWLW